MSKQKQLTPAEQDVLGVAINTALEMDVAFKLYSFRISTHEQFIARVKDLCDYFNHKTKDDEQEPTITV